MVRRQPTSAADSLWSPCPPELILSGAVGDDQLPRCEERDAEYMPASPASPSSIAGSAFIT